MKPKSFMNFDGVKIEKRAPPRDDIHDIIILPKYAADPSSASATPARPRVQRFKVNRDNGVYEDKPADLTANVEGGRKARAIAAPDEGYGPGIMLAPTRPEPAAQNGTCIIVNQENLRIRNAWTAARLDNEPRRGTTKGSAVVAEESAADDAEETEPDEYKLNLPDRDRATQFELLVASAQGKVFLVSSNEPPRELQNMGREGEIWYQLRNGFVAGSVYCRELDRVLPMVNVLSLVKVPDTALEKLPD